MISIVKTVPYETAATLLLLSREALTEDDLTLASERLARIRDGKQLLQLAYEKFSLPFVAKHLSTIRPHWFAPAMVQAHLQQMTLQTLRVAGAQVKFHRACIIPIKARHAYFKGLTIGAQYYGDLGLRFSRDVDLMVHRTHIRDVIALAQKNGYLLIDDAGSHKELTSPRDVDAVLRYQRVFNLVSPEGVLIEVHEKIDKDQNIFNENKMIWQAEPLAIQTVPMNVFPHALHFVFVAYHCARHSWSSLHWLADMDAMYRHPSFDAIAVREAAKALGLETLVQASIAFVEKSKRLPANLSEDDRVDAILNLCVLNLEGGLEIEGRIRAHHTHYGLPFDWMMTSQLKRKILFNRLRGRLRPNYESYSEMPLPPSLQWIYLITAPFSKILRRTRR